MILGQLRIGARQAKNAPLARMVTIEDNDDFSISVFCSQPPCATTIDYHKSCISMQSSSVISQISIHGNFYSGILFCENITGSKIPFVIS